MSHLINNLGLGSPWILLALFLAGSFLMIWRLEVMTGRGMEGTVLGTLVMPYCSGMGNLIFVFVLGTTGGPGREVMVNCLVNNVTNLTLLIGLPALFWGMSFQRRQKRVAKREAKQQNINRLSLLFTMTAVFFFSGAVWALARDGVLDFGDGLVLIGIFIFWQCFHIFEVLKSNVREEKSIHWIIVVDLLLLGIGTYALYVSVEGLVTWITNIESGFISKNKLGWLSGWLMVLPNALLALYYGWKRQPDVVYSSQVGDGHICIPLCLGIFCLFGTIETPEFFQIGIVFILASTAIHFLFVAGLGRLPRFMGGFYIITYAAFLYTGLVQ